MDDAGSAATWTSSSRGPAETDALTLPTSNKRSETFWTPPLLTTVKLAVPPPATSSTPLPFTAVPVVYTGRGHGLGAAAIDEVVDGRAAEADARGAAIVDYRAAGRAAGHQCGSFRWTPLCRRRCRRTRPTAHRC